MKTLTSPIAYWGNAFQMTVMMAEAQAVISMRILGVFGLWSVPSTENQRMVSEKVYAVTKGATDASLAALRGEPAHDVTRAAIRPIRRATAANSRRLRKRGLV